MKTVVWKMKVPSTALIREPKLYSLDYKNCCLWWISERAEGGGMNEALVFTGVEAYKRTQFSAYSAERMSADSLADLGATAWLEEISSVLSRRMDVRGLKHFSISFLEESPLYEFIAREFRVISPFDGKLIESDVAQRLASCVHPLERL